MLRKEESDRLALYKIPGTTVPRRTLEAEQPDVQTSETERVNNNQFSEMGAGSEARSVGDQWDGYTLKAGLKI